MTAWDKLQRKLRMVVLRRGPQTVQDVADQIPASRATVYRMMRGEIKHPSKALESGVQELVDDDDLSGEQGIDRVR